MTERRKKLLRVVYPVLVVFWPLIGWEGHSRRPFLLWLGLVLGVLYLFMGVRHELMVRRERALAEAGQDDGSEEDPRQSHWGEDGESPRPQGAEVKFGLLGLRPKTVAGRTLKAIFTVVRLRALAGWRKALSEKGKLVFGVVFGLFLIGNYAISLSGMEEAPFDGVPVDLLFVVMTFLVLMTLLQLAPLAPWFSRQQGVRFGLTAGRRAGLTVGTNLLGAALLLALLNGALAVASSGAGLPRGPEWAFEGMDVMSVVVAMVGAGPLGAVILGGSGTRRWLGGGGLVFLLVAVLGLSAVEPLWSAPGVWARGATSGTRLIVLAAILAAAFVLEQRSPDDRGAKTRKRGRRHAAGEEPAGKRRAWTALLRWRAAENPAPAGIWSRPTFVIALAEARMMLRLRQVRLNLVFSWFVPVFMAIVLRGEDVSDKGEGQFALWMLAGLAALLSVFWVAFFANLLGFTADGARRLSMSAEKALAACLPGKVLGAAAVVGGLVLMQTAVASAVLADGISPADRAMPFLVAVLSLLALAGGGTVVSILFPRKPKLHEQRDLYCSVLAMAVLGCGWLLLVVSFGGALVAARLLGGPGVALVAMTALLLVVAGGCTALVAILSRGDWLRRRLREWAVTV